MAVVAPTPSASTARMVMVNAGAFRNWRRAKRISAIRRIGFAAKDAYVRSTPSAIGDAVKWLRSNDLDQRREITLSGKRITLFRSGQRCAGLSGASCAAHHS